MLTKKDVMIWIDRVEQKALNSVKNTYYEHKGEEERRIAEESGALEILAKLEKTINQAVAENEKLNTLLGRTAEIHYEPNAYRGITSKLSDLQDVKKLFYGIARFESDKLNRMKKVYEETNRNVTANYAAVKEELKNKSNAKRCVDYLKEIGFDVSDLEKLDHTEIAVAVDRRYLFVCGDNK